jgi:hypothetical protein
MTSLSTSAASSAFSDPARTHARYRWGFNIETVNFDGSVPPTTADGLILAI